MTSDTGVPVKAWIRGVPIEPEAERQLRRVASLPSIHQWVAAMPDVHFGKGATVGSVIATKGALIPAAVGVDMRRWFINLPDADLAYLPTGTDHFDDYVEAVHWAQAFAMCNRRLMMAHVIDAMRTCGELPDFDASLQAVNCHHNYVAVEYHYGHNVWVTRKGAVRARQDDMGIIPDSMGARSYMVRGLGNPESFHSCSHGAGRTMSRNQARRQFMVADHEVATAGIECRKDAEVLDETPACYKDIDAVLAAQRDFVEIAHTLHQVVCVKGELAMMIIDGAYGEGGGQILRTALALSLVTQTPCRIEQIRAGRAKPDLLRQHLTAAQAAATIGDAEVEGLEIGSMQLTFKPKTVTPGAYAFEVGTVCSTMLVLQTVLPALMLTSGPSKLQLKGGTHNPYAPPFDFLVRVFLPLLNRMGPVVSAELERPGFYPAGGGECRIEIDPVHALGPLDLYECGTLQHQRARNLVANLPRHVAERELTVIEQETGWPRARLDIEVPKRAFGPGNVVMIELAYDHVTELFTGFGARRVPAETVARNALQEMQSYVASSAAVGVYLADQLLLPYALAGGGGFTTLPLSQHTLTNIHVIEQFLDVRIDTVAISPQLYRVEVHKR